MKKLYTAFILVSSLVVSFSLFALITTSASAATPGLPFIEDFSSSNLQDFVKTKANWSTEENAVYLAWAAQQKLDFSVSGATIGSEADKTFTIALGDVDRDGDLDLIAANYQVQTNKLYINNGDGTFSSSGILIGSETDVTHGLALGDVDGDGSLDIITGNAGSTNKVYFNTGTGTFSNTGINIGSETDQTYSVVLADIDNNGSLDLIAGNLSSTNKYYINDGTGNFSMTGTAIGSETDSTTTIAAADIDNDGDIDIIAGNFNEGNKVYRNLNKGVFSSTGESLGNEFDATYSLITGDVDNDGDIDVLTGNDAQSNKLYLNDGVGNYSSAGIAIDMDLDFTRDLKLADIDNDGDLDLFVANQIQNNKYYVNNGNGTFSAIGINIGTDMDSSSSLTLADIDNDGDLDVLVGNDGTNNKVYKQNGVSGFSEENRTSLFNRTNTTTDIELGDVDNDGDLDIVAGKWNAPSELYINNGRGYFSHGSEIGFSSGSTKDVELADLDGDGGLDLLVINYTGTSSIYLNNGMGVFTQSSYGVLAAALSGTLGDVDSDGDLDILLGTGLSQNNILYLNDGSAGFSLGTALGLDTDSTADIGFVDVDNDGDLDVIAGNDGQTNKLYLNDGNGGFPSTGTPIGNDLDSTFAIALGDVDNDGDIDFISGNSNQTNKLYLNNGSGVFSATASLVGSETFISFDITLGDIDGDGDLDLIEGHIGFISTNPSNRLYLNNGSGNFSSTGIAINNNNLNTSSVELGDLNGDGSLDLVAGNDFSDRIYFNKMVGSFSLTSNNVGNETDGTQVIELGDVDNDGDIDLIAGNVGTPDKLYLNMGNGNFSTTGLPITTANVGNTYAMALVDVDNDGDLDLIVANSGQTNKLYLNSGGGNFSTTGINIGDETDQTRSLLVADINKDGYVDVIAGNSNQINRLYLNNGSGGFPAVGTDIGNDMDATLSMALVDIDNDRKPELITGNYNQTNKYYINTGGGFSSIGSDINPEVNTTFSLSLGDIDNDGDLDLIEGNLGQPNKLYLNSGSSGFSATGAVIDSDADNTYSTILSDVDHDGDLDLLTGNNGQSNKIYLNDGTGLFSISGSNISKDIANTRNIKLADINGDGGIDLLAANSGSNNTVTYSNTITYRTNTNIVQSLQINLSETNITTVKLLATEEVNTETTRNTNINYYLSNNGGFKWYQVSSGVDFTFPDFGTNDLRWKAELHSLSPSITPVLSQITIDVAAVVGAPIVQFTSTDSTFINTPEVFDASLTTDPNGDPLFFDWEFGDGHIATGIIVNHAYALPGTYTVALHVSDGNNPPVTVTKVVTVLSGAPIVQFTSTDSTFINTPEVFDASLTTDPNGDPLFFDWEFGDGHIATGIIVNHAYALPGTYTVALHVSDGNNPLVTVTKVVTVLSGAPIVQFTSTDSTFINTSEVFDASLTTDPNGDPLLIDWEFGDGHVAIAAGVIVNHTYTLPGTYTVALHVSDGNNPPVTVTKVVTVLSGAPIVQFTSTDSIFINTPEVFDASLTTDPNGDPLHFFWEFGDGLSTGGINPVVEHVYATAGTYTARLSVDDGNNPPVTVTKVVTVLSGAPIVQFTSTDSTFINTPEVFDASLTTDPNGDPLHFFWEFGDGLLTGGINPVVEHVYATAGTYTARLSVDDGNNPPVTVTKVVTVLTGAPIAIITSTDTVNKNENVVFDASLSTDPNGDPLSYQWDFGDGLTSFGVTTTHVYAASGSYTVALTVFDGNTPTTTTKVITVVNQAPIPVIASADSVNKNVSMLFDASLSTDPNADALSYSWDFGDGVTAAGINVNHAYATSGSYTVTLTASDGESSASTSKIITVINQTPVANAGVDQTVVQRDTVTLDGTASQDPDVGDSIVSYKWTQISGISVTLNNINSAVTTFVAPKLGSTTFVELIFELTVIDEEGVISTDTILITVNKK